ncbi:hypothetical protein AAFF_G00341490 [Aldrovandia affinis]|uniref:Uncharacterized protein n=1 Tax=Aldrovandia affinis TaxID=143900 RepID=A0AAD7SMT1_9TELE|nr:hypothetical protein AAFF_G00341490 [Aldrovandia affinis]
MLSLPHRPLASIPQQPANVAREPGRRDGGAGARSAKTQPGPACRGARNPSPASDDAAPVAGVDWAGPREKPSFPGAMPR